MLKINGAEIRIRCAVCDKVVDRWEQRFNPVNMLDEFAVQCHGERDSCAIDLRRLGCVYVIDAVAFQQPKIAA